MSCPGFFIYETGLNIGMTRSILIFNGLNKESKPIQAKAVDYRSYSSKREKFFVNLNKRP